MDSSKTDRHYHFQSVELVLFLNVYSKIKKEKENLAHLVYAVGGSVALLKGLSFGLQVQLSSH